MSDINFGTIMKDVNIEILRLAICRYVTQSRLRKKCTNRNSIKSNRQLISTCVKQLKLATSTHDYDKNRTVTLTVSGSIKFTQTPEKEDNVGIPSLMLTHDVKHARSTERVHTQDIRNK